MSINISSQFMKSASLNSIATGFVKFFIAYSGRWNEAKHRQALKLLAAEVIKRDIAFIFFGIDLDEWLRPRMVDAPYKDFHIEGDSHRGWTYRSNECSGGFLPNDAEHVIVIAL